MKITDIETIVLRLPEVRPIGDGCQSVLLIRVHTDEGITGIGEAHSNPAVSKAIIDAPLCSIASRGLRELLIGENPLDIGRLWDKMYTATQIYGRRGAVMHAISGIDIALWDILGKVAGQPIHRLLGGARQTRFAVYASDLMPDTIEATVELALRHRASGYRAMKLGWGTLGRSSHQDVRRVEAVRKAVGDDFDLMVDIGTPIPFDSALYLGRAFADLGVYFLEEPLSPDDLDGFRRLVAASPTPIATGEKETTQFAFRDLMERGDLRIIQPDVARVGGISEAMRIAALAEARGVQMIPHCWATDILVAATLHVIATLRTCPYLEYNVTDNPLRTQLLAAPIRPEDGMVAVPTGPGLGITLDETTIARYQVAA
ncbi:MAG: L-rhamnonate dehydratase [Rhodospirillaceae bacterium]|nr:L-rhamnonate dehydratase [Rhodospirillaceae bacterium]